MLFFQVFRQNVSQNIIGLTEVLIDEWILRVMTVTTVQTFAHKILTANPGPGNGCLQTKL